MNVQKFEIEILIENKTGFPTWARVDQLPETVLYNTKAEAEARRQVMMQNHPDMVFRVVTYNIQL